MNASQSLSRALWLLPSLLLTGCGASSVAPMPSPGTIPAHYTITEIGTLPGFASAVPAAINTHGQIAGTAFNRQGDGTNHAFLYSNGHMQDLGVLPGFKSSYASGIDDAGDVVGTSETYINGPNGPEFPIDGFVFTQGHLQDVGTLGGTITSGMQINAAGLIAGTSQTAAGAYHTFLYQHGQMQDLGVPDGFETSGAIHVTATGDILAVGTPVGGQPEHALRYQQNHWTDLGKIGDATTFANSANDASQFIGETGQALPGTSPLTNPHAFLFSVGILTDLGTLPGTMWSDAGGINAWGIVVGDSGSHAYVYAQGRMEDLNTLIPAGSGWTLESANAINDSGQIAGEGIYQGKNEAYLLTPMP